MSERNWQDIMIENSTTSNWALEAHNEGIIFSSRLCEVILNHEKQNTELQAKLDKAIEALKLAQVQAVAT